MERSHCLIFALACAMFAGGCEKLEARQRASEAAAAYKKGTLRKAAETYEEAAKLDPSIPEVQLNLGYTYLSLLMEEPVGSKDRDAFGERAVAAFKRYIELRPDDQRGRNY